MGFYIGLMSGTSMDAIDAVLAEIAEDDSTALRIVATHSISIPPDHKQRLLSLCAPGGNEIERIAEVDYDHALLSARAVNELVRKAAVRANDILAVGSHGQTVRHMPNHIPPFTVQIGNPSVISQMTGITTVADFRRRDMAAGGQGAPLVPAFHQAMFQSSSADRIVLNIGGIANITVLSRDSSMDVVGFDTGPGNMLMDAWISYCRNLPYDAAGEWARSGRVNQQLLDVLIAEPYFRLPAPKSTGRELFSLCWLTTHLASFPEITQADVQATLCELSAYSIAASVMRYFSSDHEVLICGGGFRNDYLLERLKFYLVRSDVSGTDRLGVHPDWVEALAFAWLAKQTITGRTGNLPAVTGASQRVILGGIYPG